MRVTVFSLVVLASLTASAAGAPLAGRAGTYLDGGAARTVTRLGPRGPDGRTPVSLRHPRTGEALLATLGDEALVQLAAGASQDALVAHGLTVVRAVAPALGVVLVRGAQDEDGLDVAARLGARPHAAVAAAIPDLAFPMKRAGVAFAGAPNDPRFGDQWFWPRIDMLGAWSRETGSPATTVVVIDDGCDLQHPDLVDQLDPGVDTFSMDADPSYLPNTPVNNHGTACAGLVGARTNNGLGVAGACPGCRMRCVRLLGKDGDPIPLSADMAAFQFGFDTGAAVLSNSWGFKQAVPVPDMIRQQLEQLYDSGRGGKGTVVVFAAGNDDRALGDDEINGVRGVVTVGATNNFDELTAYSNHGPSVDVVAPTGTLTTDISGADGTEPGDYTTTFSGTSSACPIVAGIFGLMASAAPDRTAAQLEDALARSARQSLFASPGPDGHDEYYGLGEVRPKDALRLLAGEVLDGGVGDGGTTMPPGDEGCACGLGGHGRRDGIAASLAVLLFALALRRRARG